MSKLSLETLQKQVDGRDVRVQGGETDEDLILEYQTTQRCGAFEQLVYRYERELFHYLRHYLGSVENAEDVFQATFLQVHLKRDQFEPGRAFRPWLYRIATNQAIDLWRKSRRHQAVSLDESTGGTFDRFFNLLVGNEIEPVRSMIGDEQAVQVREAVDRLPERLRQVLYMVYFQGMKYKEAAETLGIPFGTAKNRLLAAIKKLNDFLSDDVW